jgi:hypothetical protein
VADADDLYEVLEVGARATLASKTAKELKATARCALEVPCEFLCCFDDAGDLVCVRYFWRGRWEILFGGGVGFVG